MIIVGMVLVAAGAVFGIDVVIKNRFTVSDIEVFGSTLGLHHAEQIFLLGALTGAVILLGLVLLIAGVVRSRTKNAARRHQPPEVVENDRGSDPVENHTARRAAEDRTPESNLEGSSTDDSRDSSPRGDKVSPSLGGSTALDQDA